MRIRNYLIGGLIGLASLSACYGKGDAKPRNQQELERVNQVLRLRDNQKYQNNGLSELEKNKREQAGFDPVIISGGLIGFMIAYKNSKKRK